MAVHSIIPNTNVSFNDIRDTLNANGGSVTNDFVTAFQERAKINVWSKHKPVRNNIDFCQDFDASKPDYNATWWRAWDGNCGFSPLKLSHYNQLPDITDGILNGWTHELPSGGAGSPYRLGDFCGYYPDARPFIASFTVPSTVTNRANNSFGVGCLISIGASGKELTFADFPHLKDYHFGVYAKSDAGSYALRVVSKNTVGSGSVNVTVDSTGMRLGGWTVYAFLAKEPMEQSSGDSTNEYYSIPNIKSQRLTVINSFIRISVVGKSRLNDTRTIDWAVDIYNDSSTLVVTNNRIMFRFSDKDFDDPMVNGEINESLGTPITLTGNGGKTTIEGTTTLNSLMTPYKCTIWVSLNSGGYKQSGMILTPAPPQQ